VIPVPASSTAGQPGSYDVDLQACAQRPDVELIEGAPCLHSRAGHEHVESTVVVHDPFDKVRDGALWARDSPDDDVAATSS
jgi:hypothetical protein